MCARFLALIGQVPPFGRTPLHPTSKLMKQLTTTEVAIAAICLGNLAAQESSTPNLFDPVPVSLISGSHQNDVAIRQDNVYFNFDALKLESELSDPNFTINLNFFPDVSFEASFESSEIVYQDGKIYNFSTGDGYWNYASFSVVNGAVTGVARKDGMVYTVGNIGNGQFTVSELDETLYEQCGVDDSFNIGQSFQQGNNGNSGRSHGMHVAHILIVFTTDCVSAEGGLDGANSLANLAVSEMNRSLANGDSTFRMNLVYTYEATTYTQSGVQGDDLSNLRATSDGQLDEVHALRDAHGADYVQLFIANYGTGIAYVNCTDSTAFAADAFSVSKNTRAAWDYTLAHELGHNMGLKHNHAGSGSGTTCSDRNYNFGYRSTNYRTIMAYNPGSVLPIYSNPDMLDPDGEVLGTSTLEDASRHIGEWYPNFIAYRGGVSIYHQINTTFDGGNGAGGNMFDIKPKTDISLTGFAINTRLAVGTNAMANIWYREGTWVGHDTSSTGWILLDSVNGTSAGEGSPTVMDLDLHTGQDKVFEMDKTYGIFIEATNGVHGDWRYTNGDDTYEDSYLRLESGCGVEYGGFGGLTYDDRIWNGQLYYDGAWGEHYLNTTLTSDYSSWNGNMFDIECHEDVVISSFDVNVSTLAGDLAGVDIWYKSGSYVGSEATPSDWTFLGTDNKAVSAGPDAYTTVAISSPELSAGNTYAFYVRVGNGDSMHYSAGSSTWNNSDMTITCGASLGGSNPFNAAATSSQRTWNGRLRYRSSADSPHLMVDNLVGGGTGYLNVSNCSPGGTVYGAYSLRGGGPTSTAWGTVYMTAPWSDFPPLTADPNGEANMVLSPPASMSGRQVWLQCLDWNSASLTNGVALTIQ